MEKLRWPMDVFARRGCTLAPLANTMDRSGRRRRCDYISDYFDHLLLLLLISLLLTVTAGCSVAGKRFNLVISISSHPPQIAVYRNAIKVTADGPREPRAKNSKQLLPSVSGPGKAVGTVCVWTITMN